MFLPTLLPLWDESDFIYIVTVHNNRYLAPLSKPNVHMWNLLVTKERVHMVCQQEELHTGTSGIHQVQEQRKGKTDKHSTIGKNPEPVFGLFLI